MLRHTRYFQTLCLIVCWGIWPGRGWRRDACRCWDGPRRRRARRCRRISFANYRGLTTGAGFSFDDSERKAETASGEEERIKLCLEIDVSGASLLIARRALESNQAGCHRTTRDAG